METQDVTPAEFLEFFEATDKFYADDELVYFDGRGTAVDEYDYNDWVFTLVNINRTCHMYVPPKLAFYFINLALSNVSLLPNALGTEYITCARMKYLVRSYKLKHLTPMYPCAPEQYYQTSVGDIKAGWQTAPCQWPHRSATDKVTTNLYRRWR